MQQRTAQASSSVANSSAPFMSGFWDTHSWELAQYPGRYSHGWQQLQYPGPYLQPQLYKRPDMSYAEPPYPGGYMQTGPVPYDPPQVAYTSPPWPPPPPVAHGPPQEVPTYAESSTGGAAYAGGGSEQKPAAEVDQQQATSAREE